MGPSQSDGPVPGTDRSITRARCHGWCGEVARSSISIACAVRKGDRPSVLQLVVLARFSESPIVQIVLRSTDVLPCADVAHSSMTQARTLRTALIAPA